MAVGPARQLSKVTVPVVLCMGIPTESHSHQWFLESVFLNGDDLLSVAAPSISVMTHEIGHLVMCSLSIRCLTKPSGVECIVP